MNNSKIKSPAFFGKLACNYEIGYVDKGVDDMDWCVIIKNSRNVWARKNEYLETKINDIKQNQTLSANIKTEKAKKEKKKYTIYNEFLDIKMKLLKETSTNLAPKELFTLAVKDWHEIKKDKIELEKFLQTYKKND